MSVLAPPGWGFLAGTVLSGGPELLPDIPICMDPNTRNREIQLAIEAIPGLARTLRPRDLKERYGINDYSASTILLNIRKRK